MLFFVADQHDLRREKTIVEQKRMSFQATRGA